MNEILIRFKDRDIRFRYTQQVVAQWTVFASFNVMINFATRHGAGVPKFNFSFLFIPIHTVFLLLLVLGYSRRYGAYCSPNPYPSIFFVHTLFFFSLYFLVRLMRKYNYFIKWSTYQNLVDDSAYFRADQNVDDNTTTT
jgi:hypothetical protein